MSELVSVTFRTAPPEEIYYPYQKSPCREVVGFSSSGSDLWTPRANAGEGYESEAYTIDGDFARTLKAFFEHWFKNSDLTLNCHMAAAGMRGLLDWDDEPTARRYAQAILEEGEYGPREPQQLTEGQQGVYAKGPRLDHSVVGLGRDEHIQLNGWNEQYISILPAAYNDQYSLSEPNTYFYTSK